MCMRMRIKTIFACCAVVASASALGGACGGRTLGGVDLTEDLRDGGEDAFAAGGRAVVEPISGGRSSGGTGGRSNPGGSGGQSSCSSSQTSCGGSCVNLASDTNHCGSCFNSCTFRYSCVAGQCRTQGTTECLPNETYCPNWGYCMDLSNNIFACGDCYSGCNNGELCSGGECLYGTCINGGTFCQGNSEAGAYSGCVTDFSTDWSHCGACGNQCGSYESCENGRCIQPSCEGYCYWDAGSECNVIPCRNTGCTDVATDVQNCGACDQSCTGSRSLFWWDSYTCSRGTCACSPFATPCGPGCATRFSYCPPAGYTGSELDLCNTLARNAYDRCGCANCLNEVRACAASGACINAMDCALQSPCIGCSEPFYSCTDQYGYTDALADSLVACLNRSCAMP